ncbi:hypothetical protein [Streptomyces malaysiensis]|uniref:Uncharacterized protein n=1 Tax=Streptomyces malaysiensis subsp. samsunensis TaxID=459658 RepID=A0A9X2LZ04_STRMQ|nr:hypothetical protein [Streptomyces samsunensis]MCQ8833135.1 hypothetical protein [Streptomyces samsunensis]
MDAAHRMRRAVLARSLLVEHGVHHGPHHRAGRIGHIGGERPVRALLRTGRAQVQPYGQAAQLQAKASPAGSSTSA